MWSAAAKHGTKKKKSFVHTISWGRCCSLSCLLYSQWHRSDGSRMSSCVIVFWACACLCIVICEWKISGRFTLRITLDLFPLLCQGWRHLHTKLSLVWKRESGAACSDLRVLEPTPTPHPLPSAIMKLASELSPDWSTDCFSQQNPSFIASVSDKESLHYTTALKKS